MTDQITHLALSEIIPGENDRTRFDQGALTELADSIKEHGLAQPITVRPLDGMDMYQIVCGERRYRAMKLLDHPTIACIIRELSGEEASAIMLCENVARADLDPIDEAHAYQTRMNRFGWTAQECAQKAGVATRRITNRLHLLNLRPDLQDLTRSGDLQIGYANIIAHAGLDANRQLIALARLRDNPAPTPAWFRREVNALLEEQAQDCLFDAALFTVQDVTLPETDWAPPPTPNTHAAPENGDLTSTLTDQIAFWETAADDWERLGKTYKRNECLAAIAALQAVYNLAGVLNLTTGCLADAQRMVQALTNREIGVLRLVAKGLTNKDIGQELNISARTAQRHLANIFGKLGARTRTEAVLLSVQQGWIALGEARG